MTYMITGGSGQLGTELTNLLEEKSLPYVSLDSAELDILDESAVSKTIRKEKPQAVFHCAAYTQVDKAEEEGKKANWEVNLEGTKNVAEVCKELSIPFIYISTDYVFDGRSLEAYTEDHPTHPINEYGKAKLAAEQYIADTLEQYYIIRTSWVFGEYGNNFVYTMKKLAESYDKLTIISDQVGRPTWTRTLAEFMLHLIQEGSEYGIYHLSNEGQCSWYDFASEILKNESVEVQPIKSEDYPQKAERPKHSVMSLKKAEQTGFTPIHWKEALKQFLNSIEKD